MVSNPLMDDRIFDYLLINTLAPTKPWVGIVVITYGYGRFEVTLSR